jgi:1,4-dihydroxy-2-naphthoate octaprenyltransferase
MDAMETFESAFRIIDSNGSLALSAALDRGWTAVFPCCAKSETIVCVLEQGEIIPNLGERPRFTFACGRDANGREVKGNGIGRFRPAAPTDIPPSDGSPAIEIAPYRLTVSDPVEGLRTIELRRDAWVFRDPESKPSTRGPRFWLRAARIVSLPLSFFPIAVGTIVAALDGRFDWLLFLFGLLGGMALHVAANFWSDYRDFVKGVDTTNALSSHTGALVDELVGKDAILSAALACFCLAAFFGGLLTAMIGWPILLFGVAGAAGGFLYTGGPAGLKYVGAGELTTGFLMGPLMVCGDYFVQTGSFSITALLLSLVLGVLVSGVTFGNNIRDRAHDTRAGVTTLPARIGPRPSLAWMRVLLLAPYALVALSTLLDRRMLPMLAVLATLPLALHLIRRMGRAPSDFAELSRRAAQVILPLRVIELHRWVSLLVCAAAVAALFLAR